MEFPPYIVFKIYSHMQDGKSSKYLNGKNTIKPASNVNYIFVDIVSKKKKKIKKKLLISQGS